jgi:hypothetical protein
MITLFFLKLCVKKERRLLLDLMCINGDVKDRNDYFLKFCILKRRLCLDLMCIKCMYVCVITSFSYLSFHTLFCLNSRCISYIMYKRKEKYVMMLFYLFTYTHFCQIITFTSFYIYVNIFKSKLLLSFSAKCKVFK